MSWLKSKNKGNDSGGITEPLLSESPPPVTGNGVLVRSCWPKTNEFVTYLNKLPQYRYKIITPELSRVATWDAHLMNYRSLSRFLWWYKMYGPKNVWFLAGLLKSTADGTLGVEDIPGPGWGVSLFRHFLSGTITKQILCKKITDNIFVAIINIVKSKKTVEGVSLNDKYSGKLLFIDYTGIGVENENPVVRVVDKSETIPIVSETTDLVTLERKIVKSRSLYVIDPNSVPDPTIVTYVDGGVPISTINVEVDKIYTEPSDELNPISGSQSAAASASPSLSATQGGKRSKKITSKNRKYRKYMTMRKIKSRKYRHYRSKKRC
jgi:hypothetical protein